MSHLHDEVGGCHEGENGIQITSENDVVEINAVAGWVKGDCGKISTDIIRASQSLPFGSTQHSPSLEAEDEVSSVHMDSQKANNAEVTEHSIQEMLVISRSAMMQSLTLDPCIRQ